MAQVEAKGDLLRSLGPLGVAFLTFSALSPAVSVYVFGSGVIHLGGTGAVGALVIGGLMVAVVGLLYGEVASAMPDAGGVFPAFQKILGPAVAFPYTALMAFISPAILGLNVLGIADNARSLAPGLHRIPTAAVCLVAATGIAVLNVKAGAKITGIFLGVEVIALGVITTVAALHPARALMPTMMHPAMLSGAGFGKLPWPMFGLAVAASVWTCGGANWAPYFAQEMVDAELKIGKVVNWVSPLAAVSVAVPLILALLSAPDLAAVLRSDAPVATFLQQRTSSAVATFINFGVLLALFNASVAVLMGLGRFLYATGRDGLWPRTVGRFLGALHPRLESPVNATVVLSVVTMGVMFFSEKILLVLISSQLILEYLLLGLVVLLGRRRGLTGKHHRTFWHPLVPILAVLSAVALAVANWFDPDAGRPSLYLLAAVLGVSFAYERLVLRKQNLGERVRL